MMNFTFTRIDRGSYGSKNDDGSWTGAVGKLQRKECDIVAAWFLFTPERATVVSFPWRRLVVRMHLYMKRPVDAYNWIAYIEPLYWNAWVSIFAFVLLAGLLFYYIVR